MAGVPGRVWIALAIYVALLATVVTPLYDPFGFGEDDSWLLVVPVVGAHIALGIAIARWRVLAAPVAFSAVALVAAGAGVLTWLTPILALPVLLPVTAMACFAGRMLRPEHAWPAALVCFGLSAVPTAAAAVETIDRSRSPHLPDRVQKQLPIRESLGNLCPGAGTPKAARRKLERGVELLVREIRRDPDALVTYTYHEADTAERDREDITVAELAEIGLDDLNSAGMRCRPDIQRKLEAALGV